MNMLAIRAEGVGKEYRIGQAQLRHNTLRDRLASSAGQLSRRIRSLGVGRPERGTMEDRFWALRDVSFELSRGETLGIIGHNGAGKSTLLKILSRITEPTTGEIALRGRVGSLLEVGTGFHTELTGRENIFLNGAILGMTRDDIVRKFDAIVAFAEIDRFIDTPVKHYSSGMYLRLGFSVAAHLEPEILIVDEVLAVGDAQFQKKCLGKMGEVASEGRTVILVSHNMTAVQSLCERALWLDRGLLVMDGAPAEVIPQYLAEAVNIAVDREWPDVAAAPGNDDVRLRAARVRTLDGSPAEAVTVRTPLELEFEYWNLRPGAHLNLSLHVYNQEGTLVFNTASITEPSWHARAFPEGLFCTSCVVPGDLLNDGVYRVELLFVKDQGSILFRHPEALVFPVNDERAPGVAWHGKWPGAVRPALVWKTRDLELGPVRRSSTMMPL
jgi:lipopolysaccharide transport system ATP-binding protein